MLQTKTQVIDKEKQKANKSIFYILPTKDSNKIKRNREIVSEGTENVFHPNGN